MVVPAAGLRARFVKEAKGYSSEITVVKNRKQADAKRSLRLMALRARHEETVMVGAGGEDEQAAADALVAIFSQEEEG